MTQRSIRKFTLQRQSNLGAVGTTTLGTTVTTGGSSSTKGTAVQLISACNFDVYKIRIIASNYGASAADSRCCLDILTGAATEKVFIADLLAGNCGGLGATPRGPKLWDFPVFLPKGTRIAARAAGARLSTGIDVGIQLLGGDGQPPWAYGAKVVTYGIGTVPDGTAITPGASGAQGAWTQVTSGTTEDHMAVVPSWQVGNDTSWNNRTGWLAVGQGASSAEVEIAGPYVYDFDNIEGMAGPHSDPMAMFAFIKNGSRLSVRASKSGTVESAYSVALHGISP